PQVTGVLGIPLGRLRGELWTLAGGGVVDRVVDVGDVVHERGLVAAGAKAVPQLHAEDERARIADVGALVHSRTAEVHPDRARRRRQLLDLPRQRVVEPHRASLETRRAPEQLLAWQRGDHGSELRPVLASG